MKRYRFRPEQHLRKPVEFERVYSGKQRAGDGRLLIFAATNDLGRTRIGLSVSRKHGGSVRRQRIKRLLREAFRLSQYDLPSGLDLILIPRVGSETSVEGFQQSLRQLTRRLHKRLAAKSASPTVRPPNDDSPTPSGSGADA